jgi:hypothetical protein
MTAGQFVAIIAATFTLLGIGGAIAYNVAQSRNQSQNEQHEVDCLVKAFMDDYDPDCD